MDQLGTREPQMESCWELLCFADHVGILLQDNQCPQQSFLGFLCNQEQIISHMSPINNTDKLL